MKKSILFIIALLLMADQINCLTCGGNCPSNTCSDCWCGQSSNIINIADQCKKYDWNYNCCQCIMSRQSGGNANAMSQMGTNPPKGPLTGLWQLSELVRTFTCQLEKKEALCQVQANMECAYKLYQLNIRLGQWKPWQSSALACGCGSKQLTSE